MLTEAPTYRKHPLPSKKKHVFASTVIIYFKSFAHYTLYVLHCVGKVGNEIKVLEFNQRLLHRPISSVGLERRAKKKLFYV